MPPKQGGFAPPSPEPMQAASAETPPLSEIPSIPIDELKEVMIQHLQADYGMLAITLSKTTDWYEADGKLHFSVKTPFEAQLLQKEKNILAQKAAIFYKKGLQIQIDLMEEKKKSEPVFPAQVMMICRQLKGAVVDACTVAVPEMEVE